MPSEKPRFTVRTKPSVLKKLHNIAEYEGRSSNKEVEQLIMTHVSNYEKEHGEITLQDLENF